MAKFDKHALIDRLKAKRAARVKAAAEATATNKAAFAKWHSDRLNDARRELKRAEDIEFDDGVYWGSYQHSRPLPVEPQVKDIDSAITELECMSGDVVQLTPSSSVLALL